MRETMPAYDPEVDPFYTDKSSQEDIPDIVKGFTDRSDLTMGQIREVTPKIETLRSLQEELRKIDRQKLDILKAIEDEEAGGAEADEEALNRLRSELESVNSILDDMTDKVEAQEQEVQEVLSWEIPADEEEEAA